MNTQSCKFLENMSQEMQMTYVSRYNLYFLTVLFAVQFRQVIKIFQILVHENFVDINYISLQDSTMRLIYSFNPYDPSEDTAPLQKHTAKGSKSVYLLSPTRDEPTLPNDAFSMDLVMSNVNITNANLYSDLDYNHMRLFGDSSFL